MPLTKTDNVASEYVTEDLIGAPVRERTMKVSENALQQLAMMFTDLYADPIEAMVRETVSNATDATIKARRLGQDAPDVEIVCPSLGEQSLKVIDHGVGMTQHELDVYFSDYGNSTKINDMSAIGSKGLGAKAMLAYSPSAKVITVKDGVEIIMTMTRGEKENFTSIESVAETDKHNGTTVIIPVKSNDIDDVNAAIDRYAKYAPAEAPITIDGVKHSLAQHHVRLGEIKIGEDVDPTTGAPVPVMGALWVSKNVCDRPSTSRTGGRKTMESVSDVAEEWTDVVLEAMKNHDAADALLDARDYVRHHVYVTLSGWNYKLDPSTGDRAPYNPRSSSRGYGKNADDHSFVVEIQPGVVNFPAHRDSIINDRRLELLIDRIIEGLHLVRESKDLHDDGTATNRGKTTAADAVALWKDLPESMRGPLVSRLFSESQQSWRGRSFIAPWMSMASEWPETFEMFDGELHGDDPSFYAVVAYRTPTNGYWGSNKSVIGYEISHKVTIAHPKDPSNKSGKGWRQYVMTSVENGQVVPFLSMGEDFIKESRDKSFMTSTTIPGPVQRELLMSDDTKYVSDYATSSRYGSRWNDVVNGLGKWDYESVRSIPVDYVIKMSDGTPYGVPGSTYDPCYMTIVQGDLGDWKSTKRKMGVLRRVARMRHEQDLDGYHVFYLVDGELDAETLATAEEHFKSLVANKAPGSSMVWTGVTTYDALKGDVNRFDAAKRAPKASVGSKDETAGSKLTVSALSWTVNGEDPWTVAASMASRVYSIRRGHSAMTGTAYTEDLLESGDPVLFYDARSTELSDARVALDVFKTAVELDTTTYWLINTADVSAAFMEALKDHPSLWVVDSQRASFNNLKAVKTNKGIHHVSTAATTAGSLGEAETLYSELLQFALDHASTDSIGETFAAFFSLTYQNWSRVMWACVEEDRKTFPYPDEEKLDAKGAALYKVSGFISYQPSSLSETACKWIKGRLDDAEGWSPDVLGTMEAWFRFIRDYERHVLQHSKETAVEETEHHLLQDAVSLVNCNLVGFSSNRFNSEEDRKQLRDGLIGKMIRDWWGSLKTAE